MSEVLCFVCQLCGTTVAYRQERAIKQTVVYLFYIILIDLQLDFFGFVTVTSASALHVFHYMQYFLIFKKNPMAAFNLQSFSLKFLFTYNPITGLHQISNFQIAATGGWIHPCVCLDGLLVFNQRIMGRGLVFFFFCLILYILQKVQ